MSLQSLKQEEQFLIKIIRRKEESIQNSFSERVELVKQTTEVMFGQETIRVNVNSFEMFFDVLCCLLGEPVLLGELKARWVFFSFAFRTSHLECLLQSEAVMN